MRENQVITLEDGKKYFIHDIIKIMNNNYLYLIRVNDQANSILNEFIIRKEKFEDGVYSIVELDNNEIEFFKNQFICSGDKLANIFL